MSYLFCASWDYCSFYYYNSAAVYFNEDISAWDTSGVTTMKYMFRDAWSFDQDLGWCVDDDVTLTDAFLNAPCASTSCGVTQGSCT